MKTAKILTMAVLTIGAGTVVFSAEKNANINNINDFQVRILEATDARDHENPVFDEALGAGRWEALAYLGQIGGKACEKVKPYLSHADSSVREKAADGAARCHDPSLDGMLAGHVSGAASPAYLEAMGFSGGERSRTYLVEQINSMDVKTNHAKCGSAGPREAALFGLMQSIVYDRMAPSALPNLDMPHLLSLTDDPCVGYQAAYLLGRFRNLDRHLGLDAVQAAIDTAPTHEIRRALVRVLRQLGSAASASLVALAQSGDRSVAMEAVRGLGEFQDAASKDYLMAVLEEGEVIFRHLALSALSSRNVMDAGVTQAIAAAVSDENPWIAVTALRGLTQRVPTEALPIAAAWLDGDDYYKAFSAMGLLAQSEEGKNLLLEYTAAHPDTIRGREAAIALDPSIEGAEKPRKTPSWHMVRSYQARELALKTSRGTICIAPSASAPYAAANFMLLADAGKMNGMLWHRVIPNFVAQAGQSEDRALANWGTIREEWSGAGHTPGTVGVATAGRDTGSTQFFINTAYNLHLNGRYTVMGQVTGGMDVAYALQEGDRIESAETVRAGSCG